MSYIIYCSDLILRLEDPEEVGVGELTNITEWLHESTEFRPAYPEGCVLRQEVSDVKYCTQLRLLPTLLM